MIHANHAGQVPKVDATACVHPSAVVIGNVQIGARVFVGPNAVIRADEPCAEGRVEAIVIESESNIQDGVIIHALGGSRVRIGKRASLAHGAVIHGPCDVGENGFVGFGSVVFKASLGRGVIIQHQVLVEGVAIPEGIHVPSMTAVLTEADVTGLSPASSELTAFADRVRRTNSFLAGGKCMNEESINQSAGGPKPQVAIVMGSKSDYEVMKESASVLKAFRVPYEIRVISAHRTPDNAHAFATGAEEQGIKLLIAAAGKAAHLAGVLAALTTLPVLGVPMTTSDLGGLDSLLSMVQMPAGIPVGTVAIGKAGAKNAALLAVAILALSDPRLNSELKQYRKRMQDEVEAADAEVRSGSFA